MQKFKTGSRGQALTKSQSEFLSECIQGGIVVPDDQYPSFTDTQITDALQAIAGLHGYILDSDAYIYGQVFEDLPNALGEACGDSRIVIYNARVAVAAHDLMLATWKHCKA